MTPFLGGHFTRELWHATQQRIQQNKHVPKRKIVREFLLRGMVRCMRCDASMSAIARNGWRNREQLRMYYCCAKSALKMGQVDAPTACDTGYVRAETVEDNVWRTVLSVLTGNNFEQALCEAQANEIQAIAPRLETLVHIKQQIADCETEAANLASALGCIGGAMMQKAIEQRVMDVENRHNDLNRQRLDRARHRRRSAISSRSLVRPTKLHV